MAKIRLGRREVEVQETLADRVVRYFAPVRASRRLAARFQMEMLSGGGYTGGSRSKRTLSGWATTKGQSADADLMPDLFELRDRSRDLVRNEPLAAGAINTVVTKVVGSGLMLQSQVDAEFLGMTPEEAAEWQRNTEREFAVFAKECDVTRKQDFYGQQDLALRATLESGDIFYLTPFVRRSGDAYGLKLQAIEADRVRNPNNSPETNVFTGGIEMDVYGAPEWVNIARVHPGALIRTSNEFDRVRMFGEKTGRKNVIHLHRPLRPGQTRGAPYLAPVIEPLKQLGRYTEAEITAAVVSGLFAVFIKGNPNGINPLESASTGATPGVSGDAQTSSWNGKLSSGLVAELGAGEDIVSTNPGRPNAAFDPFVQAVLRQIGTALEIPFELLIKHYTASYSAARAAILDAWQFIRGKRAWLATYFCQPVYELFLEEAISSGRISAPGFFDDARYRMAYANAMWNGDGPGYLNPLMEAEAAEKRMEIGLTTLKSETAEYNGGDWDANHAQQVREKQMRKDAGLEQEPPAAAPAPADDEPEEEDEETIDDEAAAELVALAKSLHA